MQEPMQAEMFELPESREELPAEEEARVPNRQPQAQWRQAKQPKAPSE
jgi:hypothetical protein